MASPPGPAREETAVEILDLGDTGDDIGAGRRSGDSGMSEPFRVRTPQTCTPQQPPLLSPTISTGAVSADIDADDELVDVTEEELPPTPQGDRPARVIVENRKHEEPATPPNGRSNVGPNAPAGPATPATPAIESLPCDGMGASGGGDGGRAAGESGGSPGAGNAVGTSASSSGPSSPKDDAKGGCNVQ